MYIGIMVEAWNVTETKATKPNRTHSLIRRVTHSSTKIVTAVDKELSMITTSVTVNEDKCQDNRLLLARGRFVDSHRSVKY